MVGRRIREPDWVGLPIALLVLVAGAVGAVLLPGFLIPYEDCAPGTPIDGLAARDCLLPAERLTAEGDLRATIVQATAGALFLTTAFFTWRTVQVNRARQATERFNSAVGHLCAAETAKAIGGAIALSRHARSGEDTQDVPVLLAAHVKQHYPRPGAYVHPAARDVEVLTTRIPVLQVVLRALGDRAIDVRGLDVGAIDARRAALPAASLRGVALEQAALNGADLAGADLRGVRFNGADLRYAALRGARLHGADFTDAQVDGADFAGAKGLASATWERTRGYGEATGLPERPKRRAAAEPKPPSAGEP